MKSYNVRLNGIVIGTVHATSENEAGFLAVEKYGMRATVELA